MADTPSRYLNRELSWLEFNQGVLDEAHDANVPVLEGLKFLAISASNLDEFFMVRVGGLKLVEHQENPPADPAGMTIREQLDAIAARVHGMTGDQYRCFLEELEPQLAQAGVRRLNASDLNERQKQVVDQFFSDEVASVMTPMAVDESSEFPLLSHQMLHMAVRLSPRDGETQSR